MTDELKIRTTIKAIIPLEVLNIDTVKRLIEENGIPSARENEHIEESIVVLKLSV